MAVEFGVNPLGLGPGKSSVPTRSCSTVQLRRYQSGEIDYTGSISKRGDRRVRTLRYKSARVVLTRYKGRLKLSQG